MFSTPGYTANMFYNTVSLFVKSAFEGGAVVSNAYNKKNCLNVVLIGVFGETLLQLSAYRHLEHIGCWVTR